MIKNLSLKTKTFILLILVVLVATGPLILYYLKTANALAELGSDETVEWALQQAVEKAEMVVDRFS